MQLYLPLLLWAYLRFWKPAYLYTEAVSNNKVMTYMYDLDEFDDVITRYMRERKIPGASIAISKNGLSLVRKGYGRASQQRLMTPWAVMRIGSVSKVVTAIGVLRLCEDGRISLNATVFGENGLLSEYRSFADSRVPAITVRDLLQHTSGWDYRVTGDPLFQRDLKSAGNRRQGASTETDVSVTDDRSKNRISTTVHDPLQERKSHEGRSPMPPPKTQLLDQMQSGYQRNSLLRTNSSVISNAASSVIGKDDVIKYMLNQNLQFNPGSRYSYFNFGYMVLGIVIERAAGRPYENFMRDLLMRHGIYRMKIGKTLKEDADISEVEYFTRNPNDRTQSIFDSRQLVAPPYGGFNMAIMEASCGWIASASDLVRLLESLTSLFSNYTVREMLSRPSYTAARTASAWYGLGLVVESEGRAFWHSGTLEGSTSVLSRDEHGFTWAVLLNSKLEPNDLGDFLRYVVRRIFLQFDETLSHSSSMPEMENDIDAVEPEFAVVPGVPYSFFDAASKDGRNFVRTMIPDYKFPEVMNSLSPKIYRLVWIDAYEELGCVFFNVIWTLNSASVRWRAYVDLTSSRYRRRFKARIAQGYRLAHVETYVSKRRMRYAAIFVKDDWPEWTAYDGYSPNRHKAEFYRLVGDGYRLVVQSVTEYKGQLYVAAIYDKIYLGDGRVRLGLSLDEFTEELERQLEGGRVLAYVQSYESRGQFKFSAIWSPKTSRYWAVSQAMTKYTLLNRLLEYSVVNVPLACITTYHNDDVLYFAALWR